jgi:hypothetical protein
MQELAKLSGSFALIFVISVGIAYFLHTVVRSLRRIPRPIPNAQLRIRSGASVYRARFLGETPEGWSFSVPLQRDSYVPIQVGEPLIIEAPSPAGLLRFRTTLRARSQNPPAMFAEPPREVHVEDRRSEVRRFDLSDGDAFLDGHCAFLVDVSSAGARLTLDSEVLQGERVRVELPWADEPAFAWTLDVERQIGKFEVRLRFEDFLELPPLK